jgi:hypothetical protein
VRIAQKNKENIQKMEKVTDNVPYYIVIRMQTEEEIKFFKDDLTQRHKVPSEKLDNLEFRKATKIDEEGILPRMVVGKEELIGWGMVFHFLKSKRFVGGS